MTPRATALVAEDEPLLREEIIELLRKLWPELEIVGETDDGVEALRMLHERKPDVTFLDIQMPGMTGLEVAKQAAGRTHLAANHIDIAVLRRRRSVEENE